jgi:cytochrome c-type biogenesis protein CcmH/NrfF
MRERRSESWTPRTSMSGTGSWWSPMVSLTPASVEECALSKSRPQIVSPRLNWTVLGVVLCVALFIGSRGPSGPPTEAQRVHRIASVMRCPTCRGLSVAQSDSIAAEQIRDEVRRRVEAGESDTQIKQYLASRFPGMLLKPRNPLVWLVPGVIVVLATASLIFVLVRVHLRATPAVSDADRRLVDRALQRPRAGDSGEPADTARAPYEEAP